MPSWVSHSLVGKGERVWWMAFSDEGHSSYLHGCRCALCMQVQEHKLCMRSYFSGQNVPWCLQANRVSTDMLEGEREVLEAGDWSALHHARTEDLVHAPLVRPSEGAQEHQEVRVHHARSLIL